MTALQTFIGDPWLYILGFFVTIIFIKEMFTVKDWLCDRLGIETKASLHQKEIDDKLIGYGERLEILETKMDKSIADDVQINEKISVLTQMIVDMQERNDESARSRLKDRIAESYRHYNALKKWTPMEKDAFDDLITSYEKAGGKNSFVHSICVPQSYTWEVIEDNQEMI